MQFALHWVAVVWIGLSSCCYAQSSLDRFLLRLVSETNPWSVIEVELQTRNILNSLEVTDPRLFQNYPRALDGILDSLLKLNGEDSLSIVALKASKEQRYLFFEGVRKAFFTKYDSPEIHHVFQIYSLRESERHLELLRRFVILGNFFAEELKLDGELESFFMQLGQLFARLANQTFSGKEISLSKRAWGALIMDLRFPSENARLAFLKSLLEDFYLSKIIFYKDAKIIFVNALKKIIYSDQSKVSHVTRRAQLYSDIFRYLRKNREFGQAQYGDAFHLAFDQLLYSAMTDGLESQEDLKILQNIFWNESYFHFQMSAEQLIEVIKNNWVHIEKKIFKTDPTLYIGKWGQLHRSISVQQSKTPVNARIIGGYLTELPTFEFFKNLLGHFPSAKEQKFLNHYRQQSTHYLGHRKRLFALLTDDNLPGNWFDSLSRERALMLRSDMFLNESLDIKIKVLNSMNAVEFEQLVDFLATNVNLRDSEAVSAVWTQFTGRYFPGKDIIVYLEKLALGKKSAHKVLQYFSKIEKQNICVQRFLSSHDQGLPLN